MRERLFRGKSKDDGEWIEGSLIISDEQYFIVPIFGVKSIDNLICSSDSEKQIMVFAIEVIPETVGQYAGLTDKNDKKIFEGDIHEAPAGNIVVQYGAYWDEDADFGGYGWHFNLRGRMYGFEGNEAEYVNVVGNIHDNPEMLK